MYVVKQQSGRYETVDTLSDGSMGSVVLARDRKMNRLVAVKTVRLKGVSAPGERQKLQQGLLKEAQVVQLLSHPNIVSIYDVVDQPGEPSPSVVMEYVPGATLQDFLKGGAPLPLDFTLTIGTQVARGLEHAHAMGVVHGDIKPSNILISDDGETAKITDFGIAYLMGQGGGQTPRLFGTPRYVSPEQILGQQADPRSDLFSFGVVLYEMLTGRSPFAGRTPKEITQEIAKGAANLSAAAVRELPDTLRAMLCRALARDPVDRFQSARQMATVLENPNPIQAAHEAVATQDLSSLVVPEQPERATAPSEEPATDQTPPLNDPTPSANRSASITAPQSPWPRLALVAALTVVPAVLLASVILKIATPDTPADGRFSTDHRIAAQVLPLFKEGRRQMLTNQPEVAIRLFRRAQDLAPSSSAIADALRRAEQSALDQQAHLEQTEEIEGLLTLSRSALDSGDSRGALRHANHALSMDPENPEALALLDAAGSLKTGRKPASAGSQQTTRTASVSSSKPAIAKRSPPTPIPVTNVPVEDKPTPDSRTYAPQPTQGPVSKIADLRVDVFSHLSKGVLTVYADQAQVLLQPFRFVQKSGFMRKKKIAGRLETSVELPSGPTELRIYVSADGQETQTVNLQADLAGGQTHVLRLIIAENGSTSAQLN